MITIEKPIMTRTLRKLFISYRSSDAPKVDKIARDLELLHDPDGQPFYETWQDKHNLPPASPNWWDAIVDAIIASDIFVFNLSLASLQSEVCRAELDYAYKRNRPIIPIVLEDEFLLNPLSGKYDLPKETWSLVPDWLAERQFLFYTGASFHAQFQTAVEMFERNWPRDIPAPRPLNPDTKGTHSSNHTLYESACDYAYRLALVDAEKLFAILVRRNDADYGDASAKWIEILRKYGELVEIAALKNAQQLVFEKKWRDYVTQYPERLTTSLFDPKGFAARVDSVEKSGEPPKVSTPAPPPPTTQKTPPIIPSAPPKTPEKTLAFDWIEVAGGYFSMGDKSQSDNPPRRVDVPTFYIAKYPVTHAQYAQFVKDGGYRFRKWWTDAGWQTREREAWTQPRYWDDAAWNGDDQPIAGISWHEAIAFTRWASETLAQQVTLPTEIQWEKAARGTNGWLYPWGTTFEAERCNTFESGINQTTPVTRYEGKGDSPYGVVDMVGNVWEWCIQDATDPLIVHGREALRGGSFYHTNEYAMVANRIERQPQFNNGPFGLRLLLVR